MAEKIWWKCNGCGYRINLDIEKKAPNPCPACQQDCTFTNVTCYSPDCGGPESGNWDPKL